MSEETLQKAIMLLEDGKTVTEVLAMFNNSPELAEELKIIGILKTQKSNLTPNNAFKEKLFSAIQSKPKVKFNLAEFLQSKLKFMLPALAATAVLILVLVQKQPAENLKTVEFSSDIDQTINGIISDYTNDHQYTSAGDEDINSLKQTYSDYNVNDIYNEETF